MLRIAPQGEIAPGASTLSVSCLVRKFDSQLAGIPNRTETKLPALVLGTVSPLGAIRSIRVVIRSIRVHAFPSRCQPRWMVLKPNTNAERIDALIKSDVEHMKHLLDENFA